MFDMPSAAERQAAFDTLFAEYKIRYGDRFRQAWHWRREPRLIESFWEELAGKMAGCSLDELGAAICPDEPTDGWREREKFLWIYMIGDNACGQLITGNRCRLVGIAYLSRGHIPVRSPRP